MRAGAFVSFVAGLLAATSATLTVWQSSYRQPRAGLALVCEQNPTKLQQYTHHFFFGRLVGRFRTGWMKRQLDNAENLYVRRRQARMVAGDGSTRETLGLGGEKRPMRHWLSAAYLWSTRIQPGINVA